MKIIKTLICAALIAAMSTVGVSAETNIEDNKKQEYIQKSKTFSTTDENFNYDFDKTVEQEGKKYNLISVDYEIVETKDLTRPAATKKQVEYTDLYTKYAGADENITVSSDGQDLTLTLESVDYTNTVIRNRKKVLTASSDFDYKTVEPTVPETKVISYFDEASNQSVMYELPLKEVNLVDDWAWIPDVTIPLTVSIYEADYYMIGDKYIPYNDEKPQVDGYEEDILKSLGLDIEKYKIDEVQWDGEPYTIGEVTYRKAIAKGQRYCVNYVAVYETEVNLPDCAGYNAVAYYTTSSDILSGETEYLVKATALYEKDNTVKMVVIYTIMLLLFAALVILVLYLIAKRKKEKKQPSPLDKIRARNEIYANSK